jgi:hypothetical protein
MKVIVEFDVYYHGIKADDIIQIVRYMMHKGLEDRRLEYKNLTIEVRNKIHD